MFGGTTRCKQRDAVKGGGVHLLSVLRFYAFLSAVFWFMLVRCCSKGVKTYSEVIVTGRGGLEAFYNFTKGGGVHTHLFGS